ncbi:MAG: hypothetical protein P8K78_05940 [Pirellulales bacterium]|nr:hypothetical protein [Pirellulales bacterium]
MEIWRGTRILPGAVVVFFFFSSACVAECNSGYKPYSILSVTHVLTRENPGDIAFASRDEKPGYAVAMQRPLPEPYSYVLASVGIASLLAMGGMYRVRKPPVRPARHRSAGRRSPGR